MGDPAFDVQTDLSTQSILLAAANHDIPSLRNLLRNTSANVQDAETGFTPLHAAIAACEPDEDDKVTGASNGESDSIKEGEKDQTEAATKTVKLLFENGAIWNDLDANGETPGCIALRLGLKELYELCVDAGVRAELLLSRLDQYQLLMGGDSESEEGDEDEDEDEEDDEEFNSDDSNDEGMDLIAKEFGVKRYGWLVYMDKKAKEEERRQKEVVKGDPAIVCLPRELFIMNIFLV